MPLEIDRIEPDGTGYAVGLRLGDRIVSVNGRVVRDPLEWRYLVADEFISIEIDRGGERFFIDIDKGYDDALAVHLKGPGFRKCNNRCIFCFIDQNPPGVRKPLRFKDEDFRLSFLHGNYVTLTNTPQEDLERIVEQRLTPIYISVHATEPELRRQLLGNPRAPDILPIMRYLAEGRIEMHAQIVLMPGLNDGEHLGRTIDDLAELYPSVGSVSVVPVGLTRHRERLPHLRGITPEIADSMVRWQRAMQKRFRERFGVRFVYLSDEFYLMAGSKVPSRRLYEGFPQVGNGVGMVRRFLDAFEKGFPALLEGFDPGPSGKLTIDLVTASLPATFLLGMVERVNQRLTHVEIVPHVVTNERYGAGITVSGLLCGGDIERALKRDGLAGDVVLLPPNVLNDDGYFLDDVHLEEFQGCLGRPVQVGTYDLVESIAMARDRLTHADRNVSRSLPVLDGPLPAETMRAV